MWVLPLRWSRRTRSSRSTESRSVLSGPPHRHYHHRIDGDIAPASHAQRRRGRLKPSFPPRPALTAGRPHVPRLHVQAVLRPVLLERAGPGEGAPDADPLRQPRSQLPHDLLATHDAAALRMKALTCPRNLATMALRSWLLKATHNQARKFLTQQAHDSSNDCISMLAP